MDGQMMDRDTVIISEVAGIPALHVMYMSVRGAVSMFAHHVAATKSHPAVLSRAARIQ